MAAGSIGNMEQVNFKDTGVGPSLQAPVVNLCPGPEYGSNMRRFQGIPGIERTKNGVLWAVWYAGGPDEPGEGPGNYVVVVCSKDDGLSWSKPKFVIDPPADVRAFDPFLWHDPLGRLWLFWAQSQGTYDGRAGVWCIRTDEPDQDNPTWTEPRRIANGVAMNKPTICADGEWLLPIGVWIRGPYKNSTPPYRFYLKDEIGSAVWVSTDQGETWSLRGRAQVPDRAFDEHMIVERNDGSLWMLVRTMYGIGESVSHDGGRTWSDGRPSAIPHVSSRFFIRRLASGKLLLVKHDRPPSTEPDPKPGGTRSHLKAFLSADDGYTWYGGLLLDDRVGVSYPDGVQSPDGAIYIIYDWNRTKERHILMAKFTEADVEVGRIVSPQGVLQRLVDQATFKPNEE
ncbi:MAG: sialidase family protein [Limnochordia bacterium]|jgi:predicted neuraminidase